MEDVFLTEREKELCENTHKICEAYKKLAPAVMASGHKPWRAIKIIASRFDCTPMWVRTILRRNGLYQDAQHTLQEFKKKEVENV
ncbi:MAG: hypothetical protein LKF81_07105 [Prevotella sp.]|jgi:hypothetical protein|nr:hypothetical protein [Prevotella sp.]